MNELNKQYFETKEKHKKSVHKNAWILWLLVLIFFIITIVIEINNQQNENISKEEILNKIDNASYADNNINFTPSSGEFKINIPKGFNYSKINNKMLLFAISLDSTLFTYIVKKDTLTQDYISLINQWEKKLKETEDTYKFYNVRNDSLSDYRTEYADFQVEKESELYKGRLMIVEINKKIFIVQGYSIYQYWENEKKKFDDILKSFEIQSGI